MQVSLLSSQLRMFGAHAIQQVISNGNAQQAALHLVKSLGFKASVVESAEEQDDKTRDLTSIVVEISRTKEHQLRIHPHVAPAFLRIYIHPDSDRDDYYYSGLVNDPERFIEFLVAFGVHGKVSLPDIARISVAQYVETGEINFNQAGIAPIVAALAMSV